MGLFDRFRRTKTTPEATPPRPEERAVEAERLRAAEDAAARQEQAEREAQEREQAEREQAEREQAEREARERDERAARTQASVSEDDTATQSPDALAPAADAAQEADPDAEPDEDPAVAAERAKVRRMLDEVGPELRQRRIVDLLGATFGRLAPVGEWGSVTIEFRPAPERVFLKVGVAGPEGSRGGEGSWNPAVSMVEMLIQELQHSMAVPGQGTWIDGRITFTHRGPREDKRGRPLAPEADVAVNWSEPPTVGLPENPYTAEEAAAFLQRYPRDEVPQFLADLAQGSGQRRRRRWF